MNGRQLLRQTIEALRVARVSEPERDAKKLLALHLNAGSAILELDEEIPSDRLALLEADIARRVSRIPMSQILGSREFYGRFFVVTSDVLDPRPDTETLVQEALKRPFQTVLDLGTGSGCILATLLCERPNTQGMGTDSSAAALSIAHSNCVAHDLESRATLNEGSWYEAVAGTFDLIVSNPPYISATEMNDLQPEVRLHEPRMALTDEGDGLTCYRAIIGGYDSYLNAGGRLIVEIGPTQGAAVSKIMIEAGLTDVAIAPDLDGRDRVVVGHKPHN